MMEKNPRPFELPLSAANKDGGAHVDSKLDQYYEVLAGGEYASDLTEKTLLIPGIHRLTRKLSITLLRQFGYETIVSVRHFKWL